MIDKIILEQIKILEETAEEEAIHPDDLYFVKLLASGKVLKRSFKKSLRRDDEMAPMTKEAKLELINHWNTQAAMHTPPTYLYWL